MGNAMLTPCFQQNSNSMSPSSSVHLVFWEGTTRTLKGRKHIAGKIMFEFPDMMVCHADSFFIGHPVPALAIDDKLAPGQTYFVLPINRFACGVLTTSSLVDLRSCPSRCPIKFRQCPFEYLKGSNGRVLIKVMPEFITRLIVDRDESKEIGISESSNNNDSPSNSKSFLCSTPELQKHYDQLVKTKDQVWSPKLETISENKVRFSPCRFIGLEWKEKEKSGSNVY